MTIAMLLKNTVRAATMRAARSGGRNAAAARQTA